MAAQLLDGKAISAEIKSTLAQQVDQLIAQGKRKPGLAVVLVAEHPASQVYVRKKQEACEQVGMISELIKLDADVSETALLELINGLNQRDDIDGILVQLPLPDHINEALVTEQIRADKDVDGFHPYNIGRLALRMPLLQPCTPKGIMTLLDRTGVDLTGMDAVIIGQSNIVGRPMALELLMARCTITVCHSRTKSLEDKVRGADVVVAAVGLPGLVRGDWIKPGAIVIDVGINRRDDGTLCGDVDYESARQNAAWITPVPGGVGPMTVATLLENTLRAYQTRERGQAS